MSTYSINSEQKKNSKKTIKPKKTLQEIELEKKELEMKNIVDEIDKQKDETEKRNIKELNRRSHFSRLLDYNRPKINIFIGTFVSIA